MILIENLFKSHQYSNSRIRAVPYVFVITLLLIIPKDVYSDSRKEYPIQLQAHMPFEDFRFYAGYHLSNHIYIGITMGLYEHDFSQFNRSTGDCYEPSGTVYNQDGFCNQDHSLMTKDAMLELRYSPIDNGFFLSLAYINIGKELHVITFDKRDRKIGDNTYNADLIIEKERKKWTGFGYGLGFNYVFKKRVSISIGLIANLNESTETDIMITSANNDIIDEDFEKEIKNIRDTARFKKWDNDKVGVFVAAIGCNF
ncbi:MAG: hypothetical protein GY866_08155 [Proteobacteria bacterium]|nr:hypothetical protein [Pseudomonadota bacterium]